MKNIGYSGINSDTFIKGYNSSTGEFNKGLLTFMRYPLQIYLHVPRLTFKYRNTLMVENHLCGKTAVVRTEKHGGVPIVFSVNLDSLVEKQQCKFNNELKDGKRRRHSFVIDQNVVQVEKIYGVRFFIQDICTILSEIIDIPSQNLSSEILFSY